MTGMSKREREKLKVCRKIRRTGIQTMRKKPDTGERARENLSLPMAEAKFVAQRKAMDALTRSCVEHEN